LAIDYHFSFMKYKMAGQLTLSLQKSRMLQIQGVNCEAVVIYREPLTTLEMRYHRLSRRVKNMTILSCDIGIHLLLFPAIGANFIKIIAIIAFITLLACFYATLGSI